MEAGKKKTADFKSAKVEEDVLLTAKSICATSKKRLADYITEAVKKENKLHKK